MRPSFGDYEINSSNQYSKQFAQIRFLIVISLLEPNVLGDLYKGPYAHFRLLTDTIPDKNKNKFWQALSVDWHLIKRMRRAEAKAFLVALDDWSARWHLDQDWCLAHALKRMRQWLGLAEGLPITDPTKLNWYNYTPVETIFLFPQLSGSVEPLEPVTFDPPAPPKGWPDFDPGMYRQDDYVQRAEWEAREEMDRCTYLKGVARPHREAYIKEVVKTARTYCEKVQKRYLSAVSPQDRQALDLRPKTLDHLVMTTLYQVMELERPEIARIFSIPSNRADIAINRMLVLLRIPDRQGVSKKRGPKPNAKATESRNVQEKINEVIARLTPNPFVDTSL